MMASIAWSPHPKKIFQLIKKSFPESFKAEDGEKSEKENLFCFFSTPRLNAPLQLTTEDDLKDHGYIPL